MRTSFSNLNSMWYIITTPCEVTSVEIWELHLKLLFSILEFSFWPIFFILQIWSLSQIITLLLLLGYVRFPLFKCWHQQEKKLLGTFKWFTDNHLNDFGFFQNCLYYHFNKSYLRHDKRYLYIPVKYYSKTYSWCTCILFLTLGLVV